MRRHHHALALIVILLGLLATTAHAARVALVIGNDTYANVARLKNARADAKAMAKALEGSGFRVMLVMDADREAMNEALRRFRASIVGGDETVFSYAGHAVELDGVNYLLPTDIRDDNDERVANDALPLQRVLSGLAQQKQRFSLVIIDACRDNPFAGKTRNVATRGLVPTAMAVKGQMIIYSAGAGQRALDRLRADDPSPNSVFTRVFVREIEKSGQPVHEVVRLVKDEVMRLAESVGHEQMPAIYDQSVGTFYFRGSDSAKTIPTVPTTPALSMDADEQIWQEAKRLETVEGYEAYLEAYPKGKYAAMARAAKKKLTVVASAAPTTAAAAEISMTGKTFRDCPTCPEMVVIPSGEYRMGSPSFEAGRRDDEGPVHPVRVKSFALGKREVTRGEFRRFVLATGRSVGNCAVIEGTTMKIDPARSWANHNHGYYTQTDDHPVACVSFDDAQAYALWLGTMTGKPYRLPSESEWEYAARGGGQDSRYWGNGERAACQYANVADETAKRRFNWSPTFDCEDKYAGTAPVGSYKPNAFGLFDMLGNVREWVEDCYHETYDDAPTDARAWVSGDGECALRVNRGGAFDREPAFVRSAARSLFPYHVGDANLGFRIARSLP